MSEGLTDSPRGLKPAAIAPEQTRTTPAPLSLRSSATPSPGGRSRSSSGSPVGPTREAVPTFTTTRSPETISGLVTLNLFLGLELEGHVANPYLVTLTRTRFLQAPLAPH